MKISQKGSLQVILLIIVLIVGLIGGFFLHNTNSGAEDTDKTFRPISDSVNNTNTASSTVSYSDVKTVVSPIGYSSYTNQTIGFSTIINDKGRVGDVKTDTLNWAFYDGLNPQFIYVYGPDPKTDVKSWIVVWQEEKADCLPNLVTDQSGSIETKKSMAGYTYTKRVWGDAAMGQYEDLTINSIATGKKRYCVVGQLHGSRPYNLEGEAYEDREKINSEAVTEFKKVLDVFVNNFKFI